MSATQRRGWPASQWVESSGFCHGRGSGRLCSLPRHRTQAPRQRHASALVHCMWQAQDTGKESAEALHPCNLGCSPWAAAWSPAQRPRHRQEHVRTQPLQQLLPSRRYHTWKKCLGLHPGRAHNTSLPGPSAAVGDRVRRLGAASGGSGCHDSLSGPLYEANCPESFVLPRESAFLRGGSMLGHQGRPCPSLLSANSEQSESPETPPPVRSWCPSPSASSRLFF